MNIYYYIYAYLRKSDLTPYYIGKGSKNRAWERHIGLSVPKDKTKIVLLETNLTEIGALALERRMIRWWGRKDLGTGILLNRTDGGEGSSGLVMPQSAKDSIAASKRGGSSWNKNLPCSDERKANISKATQGRVPWNKGLTKDDPRVAQYAAACSVTKKGSIPWNKGRKSPLL